MHAFDIGLLTDGQTEFSSLDRVCIACSAVIKRPEDSTDDMEIFFSEQHRTNRYWNKM